MSDTKVYKPYIRALIGTASQYCEAVVLESSAVPSGTTLGSRILLVVRRGAQAMYNQRNTGSNKGCEGSLVDGVDDVDHAPGEGGRLRVLIRDPPRLFFVITVTPRVE